MADDYMMLCQGCWAELVELRRMVLHELPALPNDPTAAYVAVNLRDLGPLKHFAEAIKLDHHWHEHVEA